MQVPFAPPQAPLPSTLPPTRGPWPLQMGQPLTELQYSQQQCKCNRRQIGSELPTPPQAQMQ